MFCLLLVLLQVIRHNSAEHLLCNGVTQWWIISGICRKSAVFDFSASSSWITSPLYSCCSKAQSTNPPLSSEIKLYDTIEKVNSNVVQNDSHCFTDQFSQFRLAEIEHPHDVQSVTHILHAWIRNAAQKHHHYHSPTLQKQQIHLFWLFFLEALSLLICGTRGLV